MQRNDFILLTKVKKKRAHTAAHCTVLKLLDKVAACSNNNPALVCAVNVCKAQEKFKTLFNVFESKERREQNCSGMEGGLNEVDKLLTRVVKDIEHGKRMNEIEHEGQLAATERKVKAGARLLALANGTPSESGAVVSEPETADSNRDSFTSLHTPTLRGPKSRRQQRNGGSSSELEKLRTPLKGSELAFIELKECGFNLEECKHDDMIAQRGKDRQKQTSDRDQTAQADVEKLKVLRDLAIQCIAPANDKHLSSSE